MAAVRPLRFGLAGTGHWARITHAPALARADGIEFAAVWGRNREAAGSLAAAYQVRACSDFDDFLAGLDAVAFSVPPEVQSVIAVRAARAGKHPAAGARTAAPPRRGRPATRPCHCAWPWPSWPGTPGRGTWPTPAMCISG